MKTKPTVYLCKSLKTDEKKLEAIRQHLKASGYFVQEYKTGKYDPRLRVMADFVLVVPYEKCSLVGEREWEVQTGRGQYDEIIHSCREEKPAFIYMGHAEEGIIVSKVKESLSHHCIENPHDWKNKYGRINSYVKGDEPVSLDNFVSEIIGVNEAFVSSSKLLLILN